MTGGMESMGKRGSGSNNSSIGGSSISLRDYFAGQVLTGYYLTLDDIGTDQIAEDCYSMADAMLRERSGHNGSG